MKYLIFCLLLVGCKDESDTLWHVDPGLNSDPVTDYQEQVDKLKARGQKYKTPNEFTLKNGCIVRVVEDARVERYLPKPEYLYQAAIILNEWSDKCSSLTSDESREIHESSIKSVRYK